MTVQEIIFLLQLQPHPKEGGFFAETYRSAATLNVHAGPRNLATAIFCPQRADMIRALTRA